MPTESKWVAVHVEVADSAADAVVNFLVEHGAGGVLTDEIRRDGAARMVLEAHVPIADGAALATALRAYLHELERLDPVWSAGPVDLSPVPAVDWEAIFRAHHTPLAIGSRLMVAPPWDVPADPAREILIIEPGMAFGTGQHATTRTCLEELEVLVLGGGIMTALDVGTGSGVLAAALARLGVPRVAALDADVAVLPLARENLDRNRAHQVALFGGTIAAVGARFDLVIANILADTLIAEASALAAAVAPGGRLVLSGIVADQADRVAAAFPGWHVTAVRAEDVWRTLRLERKAT
jgi:ribosomal protein L11 methyltransferase